MRRFRVLALLALLGMVLPQVTVANDFGSNWPNPCDTTVHSQCRAENATHTVYLYGITTTDLALRIRYAITNVYNPTDMTWSETTFPTGADAIAYDDYYGLNGYWGWTQCAAGATYGGSSASHTRWCKPQQIRFNKSYGSSWDGDSQLHYITCHELGHTAGLRHNTDQASCMRSNDGSGSWWLSSHDESHINSAY